MMNTNLNSKSLNKRTAIRLSVIVFFGLAFSFALAPLYDVMCKKLGLNGKADSTATAVDNKMVVDKSRWINVTFVGNTMPGLAWTFTPSVTNMRVHPGEINLTTYVAKNIDSKNVVGVAVPSITPELASLHFKKTECFCFQQQGLDPLQSKTMPLRFYVSPDLPKDVKSITLSYAFYNQSDKATQAALIKSSKGTNI